LFPSSGGEFSHKQVTFGLMICKSVFRIPEDVLDDKTKAMVQKGKPSNRGGLTIHYFSLEPFKAKEHLIQRHQGLFFFFQYC